MNGANRKKFLLMAVCVLAFSGCSSQTPATSTSLQEDPEKSPLLAQSASESAEEFVVRIAALKIIHDRPFMIALSTMESESNLWLGVSPEARVLDQCWIVEIDSMKHCADEDIRNYIGNPTTQKIFFAPAYSGSSGELFILDYYHPPFDRDWVEKDMQDAIDGYRLVIELQNGKWLEKSLIQVY